MAHPYIFEGTFDAGTKGNFDTETDTESQLDFAHYKTLALYPWKCAPYEGAYAMRLQLTGGTADAILVEADTNISDTATSWFRFPIWFSPTFTGSANDTFAILELTGAGSAVTVSIGARIVAATNVINIGAGAAASAAVPATFASQEVERGKWHTVEAKVVIQTGGTGTVDLYITPAGQPQATVSTVAVTGATNIAVTDSNYGIQDHLATTTGVILLGNLVQDDAQLFVKQRYPDNPAFTISGHAFVGPGWISGAALLTNEATNAMALYDTDTAGTSLSERKVFLDLDNQTSFGGDLFFAKGCYVVMSGTDPVGQVMLSRNSQTDGVHGPLYHSDAGLKRWARAPAS